MRGRSRLLLPPTPASHLPHAPFPRDTHPSIHSHARRAPRPKGCSAIPIVIQATPPASSAPLSQPGAPSPNAPVRADDEPFDGWSTGPASRPFDARSPHVAHRQRRRRCVAEFPRLRPPRARQAPTALTGIRRRLPNSRGHRPFPFRSMESALESLQHAPSMRAQLQHSAARFRA